MDRNGMLLAVRSDKVACHPQQICFVSPQSQTGCHIQVFNYEEGSLHSVIDSHGTRLKRPTGEPPPHPLGDLQPLTIRSGCGGEIRLHCGYWGGLCAEVQIQVEEGAPSHNIFTIIYKIVTHFVRGQIHRTVTPVPFL